MAERTGSLGRGFMRFRPRSGKPQSGAIPSGHGVLGGFVLEFVAPHGVVLFVGVDLVPWTGGSHT